MQRMFMRQRLLIYYFAIISRHILHQKKRSNYKWAKELFVKSKHYYISETIYIQWNFPVCALISHLTLCIRNRRILDSVACYKSN